MRRLKPLLAGLACLIPTLAAAQVATKDWQEALSGADSADAAPLEAPRLAAPAAAAGSSSDIAQLPLPGGAAPSLRPLPKSAVAAPAAALAPGMGSLQRQQLENLTAENQLVHEQVSKRLKDLIEQKEELGIRADLEAAQLHEELSKLDADYQRLLYQDRLEDEQTKHALEQLDAQQKRLAAEDALTDEQHKKELEELHFDKDKLSASNDELQEKLRAEQLSEQTEKMQLDLESQRMSVAEAKLKLEQDRLSAAATELQTRLDERAKKEAWKDESNHEPEELSQPFKDGVLTISDRRIPLNGPIVEGMAHEVSERINYFNNVSTAPIFVVIDSSPGGSLMEGHRILKSIQASRAPVYVVVKGFAASMAAVIATLAPHSFAYPNAVILHHQPWTMTIGNPTEQKEQLEILQDWYRRLGGPVAKKMGLSLADFTKDMYKHNSDGDWQEFGDDAAKLKWVDRVAAEVRETGYYKKPDEKSLEQAPPLAFGLKEQVDEHGQRYVQLPRLSPFDAYWIYNPDHYYR